MIKNRNSKENPDKELRNKDIEKESLTLMRLNYQERESLSSLVLV